MIAYFRRAGLLLQRFEVRIQGVAILANVFVTASQFFPYRITGLQLGCPLQIGDSFPELLEIQVTDSRPILEVQIRYPVSPWTKTKRPEQIHNPRERRLQRMRPSSKSRSFLRSLFRPENYQHGSYQNPPKKETKKWCQQQTA